MPPSSPKKQRAGAETQGKRHEDDATDSAHPRSQMSFTNSNNTPKSKRPIEASRRATQDPDVESGALTRSTSERVNNAKPSTAPTAKPKPRSKATPGSSSNDREVSKKSEVGAAGKAQPSASRITGATPSKAVSTLSTASTSSSASQLSSQPRLNLKDQHRQHLRQKQHQNASDNESAVSKTDSKASKPATKGPAKPVTPRPSTRQTTTTNTSTHPRTAATTPKPTSTPKESKLSGKATTVSKPLIRENAEGKKPGAGARQSPSSAVGSKTQNRPASHPQARSGLPKADTTRPSSLRNTHFPRTTSQEKLDPQDEKEAKVEATPKAEGASKREKTPVVKQGGSKHHEDPDESDSAEGNTSSSSVYSQDHVGRHEAGKNSSHERPAPLVEDHLSNSSVYAQDSVGDRETNMNSSSSNSRAPATPSQALANLTEKLSGSRRGAVPDFPFRKSFAESSPPKATAQLRVADLRKGFGMSKPMPAQERDNIHAINEANLYRPNAIERDEKHIRLQHTATTPERFAAGGFDPASPPKPEMRVLEPAPAYDEEQDGKYVRKNPLRQLWGDQLDDASFLCAGTSEGHGSGWPSLPEQARPRGGGDDDDDHRNRLCSCAFEFWDHRSTYVQIFCILMALAFVPCIIWFASEFASTKKVNVVALVFALVSTLIGAPFMVSRLVFCARRRRRELLDEEVARQREVMQQNGIQMDVVGAPRENHQQAYRVAGAGPPGSAGR
ncbi:hypothetical protein C8035_v008774 [Colletotrichum spinosum]|uniref:Uncharacterized protein n=1 Tax=Colletotrichum spinosum TaxID=1347390 RepID=A0A4R8QDK1_9PEZI|nr:hypothetical protein C8035_v008774 [Colletotrichum spinosum]